MDGDQFEQYRSSIEGLAYRMLGSRVDAQDIAQDTYLRWQKRPRGELRSEKSWLLKTASRLALDRLKSAQRNRETYVGPWLPEPWLIEESAPDQQAMLDDTVTIALMIAMERLSPAERAAFLLHDVFGLTFDEIAEALGKSTVACRQLASRGRASIRDKRPRFDLNPARHQALLDAFLAACNAGDLAALKDMLAEDATLVSDSGGKAISARRVIESQDKVSRFFQGVFAKARRRGEQRVAHYGHFNGLPALMLADAGQPHSAFSLSIVDGKIQSIYVHRNPDKLALLGSVPR
ncbi:RNA polymerase sigma factor SigJ [Cerasicoccus fimbriatus]|uniref:RNA polymerase sigma factor SigJ n=1 Tax=Cerasicoccus fimbriatus TaxID=3014554 RepID=UPI0022B58E36|nr:RNA polymerase sigma factor SigJ [Cerasicoccus sp. TK19100]